MTTSKQAENRRSSRHTPYSQVSVILYRENARPRGCYVSNYSDHGMLLKCMTREKATRRNALKVDDSASVHFWDRGEPGRSDKVAGRIVRVDDNLVAMEYSTPGTPSVGKLINLLQRKEQDTVTEKGSMKERPIPKLRLPEKDAAETVETSVVSEKSPKESKGGGRDLYTEAQTAGNSNLQFGLLVLALLGVILLGLYSYSLSGRVEELTQIVDALQTDKVNQVESVLPTDLPERLAAVEQKQADMSATVGDMAKQSDLQAAVEELGARLADMQKQAPVAPAPAAVERTDTEPAAASVDSAAAGSWVVNLATLSDSDAVNKFISKASNLGFDVRAEQVAVNDKQMYRLSIPGIASYGEAEKLAVAVQQQLGLSQKPWIAKQ